MFIPAPVRLSDGRIYKSQPLVNGLLVALNVLIFWFGWHPYVGPGTGILSILTYSFGHANTAHLIGNMWALLVFGTPVNRRLGNGWYLIAYVGAAMALGLFARLFIYGNLIGASGAIFAVIAIALLLFPSAKVDVWYFTMFPTSLLVGLFLRPPHFAGWFIHWGLFQIKAYWGLLLVPLMEFAGLYWYGLNWTNLGHLTGLMLGVAIVLLLPSEITLGRRARSAFA